MEKKFGSKEEYFASIGLRPDGQRGRVYHKQTFTDEEKGTPKTRVTCSLCKDLYDGGEIEYCPYCAYSQQQRVDYLRSNT